MAPSHKNCIDVLKIWLQERNIDCVDFEEKVGNQDVKRPDLLLPSYNTLIEVKTMQPKEDQISEEKRITQDLQASRVASYFHPTFRERFFDDLKQARKQFRGFPNHSTAVIFFDFHSSFHRQDPIMLLRGQQYLTIAVPKNPKIKPFPIKSGHSDRPLRHDLNNEIGAVVFPFDRNEFRVFYNQTADESRKIPKGLFSSPKDKHYKYFDDNNNPVIVEEMRN
jgi:hypothetical protein